MNGVRGESLQITPEIREMASRLSPDRMDHIIERHTIDAPYPDPRTTQYPADWDDAKIFEAVQSVASDPNSVWERRLGDPEAFEYIHSKRGELPARFTLRGEYEGFDMEVSVEPHGRGIVTGYILNENDWRF